MGMPGSWPLPYLHITPPLISPGCVPLLPGSPLEHYLVPPVFIGAFDLYFFLQVGRRAFVLGNRCFDCVHPCSPGSLLSCKGTCSCLHTSQRVVGLDPTLRWHARARTCPMCTPLFYLCPYPCPYPWTTFDAVDHSPEMAMTL